MARKKRGWLGRWLRWTLVVLLAALGAAAAWVALTWPDVAALATTNPTSTAFIDAARARGDRVEWRWVPYDEISRELAKAVVAAEDMSFFSHRGFDTHELRIAVREAVQGERVRGASTITQQLAKNLWLSPSRSPLRKLREVVLTWQLERNLPKRRILELYLNVAQFGPTTYGAEAAARRYFGIPASVLDADQAAALAASLPRPASWHPGVDTRGYRQAVARVRARAEQSGWLDRLLSES
ncbi:MAG TPA: monofunctional biosynthetic peptidoglycan transglycosylase [Methylomirabilota bacterium]|nr:monofunctional biosynthetic peptidoglycan transglycosylase [Methylomirabilota bacterium]